MKLDHLRNLIVATAAAFTIAVGSPAQSDERYTIGSLAEGTTPFLVNTAWANAINNYVPGHKAQVSAVGAATKHAILVTSGKMDFSMYEPIKYNLLYNQIGPFKNIENGPELTSKISQLFSYSIGSYHAVVYADSGIETFEDIKGKKVFLGPPSSVASRNTKLIVEAMTGYKPGESFEQVKMGWGAAAQAFQDRKFDVWLTITTSPSPAISQLTLSNKIRLLSLDEKRFDHPSWVKYMSQPGRNITTIDPADYGPNLVNTDPILVTGAMVGLAVRSDMDADLVYQMMRAFWDHQEDAHAMASFMPKTINLEEAVKSLAYPVHPGAIKFYEEKGIDLDVMRLD
jgi:TRAP transporter TAXI family solute receptor